MMHNIKDNPDKKRTQGDRSRQNNMHINYYKTNKMILGRTNKQNVSQGFGIRTEEKHIKKTQKH